MKVLQNCVVSFQDLKKIKHWEALNFVGYSHNNNWYFMRNSKEKLFRDILHFLG